MASRLKKFDNFNKSHYLSFVHLNKFFWEGVRKFYQTLKGVHETRGLRTLVYSGECDGKTMANCWYVRISKDVDLWCSWKKTLKKNSPGVIEKNLLVGKPYRLALIRTRYLLNTSLDFYSSTNFLSWAVNLTTNQWNVLWGDANW